MYVVSDLYYITARDKTEKAAQGRAVFVPGGPPGLQPVKQLEILRQAFDGFQGCLVQEPTEHKGYDGKPDLPVARCIGTEPDERQGQRPDAQEDKNDKTFSEIPLCAGLSGALPGRRVEKLAAVFAFYRVVLDFFGTEWALFHCLFLSG